MNTLNTMNRALLGLIATLLLAPPASAGEPRTVSYDYNDRGHLTGANYGDGAAIAYTYDEVGNIVSVISTAGSALLPLLESLDPTDVTATSVSLRALVVPNHSPTAFWFEWGTDENLGTLTAETALSVTTVGAIQSVTVDGLEPATTYYFRVAAQNAAGVAVPGEVLSFTTPTATLADLSVSRVPLASIHTIGEITTAVTVANQGPQAATDVTFVESLIGIAGVLAVSSTTGVCAIDHGDAVCDLGTLESGASATITILVSSFAPGWVVHSATATASTSDPDTANNLDAAYSIAVAQDFDGDGLDDYEDTDDDNDLLPDEYEQANGLDPFDAGDAAADPDGDGAANLDEYLSKSDPQDAQSVPQSSLVCGIEWTNPAPQGATLRSVTTHDGTTVAVGEGGVILVQKDGEPWTGQNSQTEQTLVKVDFFDGRFVAVGEGVVLESENGISWTLHEVDYFLYSIAYSGSKYVAVGESGVVLTSTDLVDWTIQLTGFAIEMEGIVWTGSQFVAVGHASGTGYILTSPDAISWEQTWWTDTKRYSVAWNGTLLVSGGSEGYVWTSTDGDQWDWHWLGGGEKSWINNIVWDGSQFVAVGGRSYGSTYDGTSVDIETEEVIATSPNGFDWTVQSDGTSRVMQDVTTADGAFVAVGREGAIMRSASGVNWLEESVAVTRADVFDMAIHGNHSLAVGRNGTVVRGFDGSNWVAAIPPTTSDLFGIASNGEIAVAVGEGGVVITSPDGLQWSAVDSPTTTTLHAVTAHGSSFVAVGGDTAPCTVESEDSGCEDTGCESCVCALDANCCDYYWSLTCAALVTSSCPDSCTAANPTTVLFSGDGSQWSAVDIGTEAPLQAVASNGDTLVAVGGTDEARALFSQDGLTWTEASMPEDATSPLFGVTENQGGFIAVGDYGTVLSSADGQNGWTLAAPVTDELLYDVATSANLVLAVGNRGTLLSNDGSGQWEIESTGTSHSGWFSFHTVDFSGSRFLLGGTSGSLLRESRSCAQVSIDQIATPATAEADAELTWTLTVHNAGPVHASQIVVEDWIPEGVTNISAESSDGSCAVDGRHVECSANALAIDEEMTITLSGTASKDALFEGDAFVTTIKNKAMVHANESTVYAKNTTSTLDTTIYILDADGDGVTYQTDNCLLVPNLDQANADGDAAGDACDPDDDNDGLPDIFENEYGLNPLDPSDANTDVDGDGYSALEEYAAGTDPSNAVSRPTTVIDRGLEWVLPTLQGHRITRVVLGSPGSGTVIAFATSGLVLVSDDHGLTWDDEHLGITLGIADAVWGNSQFVAVGYSGTIMTSPDGRTWTQQASPASNTLGTIAWSGSQYVVMDYSGYGLYSYTSPDGINWSSHYIGYEVGHRINSLVYGNGLFVCVGYYGRVMTSTDGISWTEQTKKLGSELMGIAWNGSLFVAVGQLANYPQTPFQISSDGINWTPLYSGTTGDVNAVAWNGSEFVAVGASTSADGSADAAILTSSNGQDWTSHAAGTSRTLGAISWTGERAIAAGDGGVMIHSTNSTSWTLLGSSDEFAADLRGIAANDDQLIAVGDSVYTSFDGGNWLVANSGVNAALNAVTWGDQFVAVGDNGAIYTTPGGTNTVWTPRSSGVSETLNDVVYHDGLYVAVGTSGTVLTSFDGASWIPQSAGVDAQLNAVTWSDGFGLYLAVGPTTGTTTSVAITSPDGTSWSLIDPAYASILPNNVRDTMWVGDGPGSGSDGSSSEGFQMFLGDGTLLYLTTLLTANGGVQGTKSQGYNSSFEFQAIAWDGVSAVSILNYAALITTGTYFGTSKTEFYSKLPVTAGGRDIIFAMGGFYMVGDDGRIVRSATNEAPVLEGQADLTVNENVNIITAFCATDPNGTYPALLAESLPEGAVLIANGPGCANLHWKTDFDDADQSPYAIKIIATDGELSDESIYTIHVTDVNRAPIASINGPAITLTGDIAALDSTPSADPDGDPLTSVTWSLATSPSGSVATLSDTDQAVATLTADTTGEYTVSLVVSDGESSSVPAEFTVTFVEENLVGPEVAGATFETLEDVPIDVELSVLTSDVDTLQKYLSWSVVNAVGGSAELLSDGHTVRFTPAPNANVGPFHFSYVAFDGLHTSEPATVSIQVQPVEDPPVELDPITESAPNGFSSLSDVVPLTAIGDTLYFAAASTDEIDSWSLGSTSIGVELWKTDGPAPADESDCCSANQTPGCEIASVEACVCALDSYCCNETVGFWDTQCAQKAETQCGACNVGTVLVKDINLDTADPNCDTSPDCTDCGICPGSSQPRNAHAHKGTLYFAANDGATGFELWRSDGTQSGTALDADVNPGPASSDPGGTDTRCMTSFDGQLVFTAKTDSNGRELWRSAGNGATLISDINPGPADSISGCPVVFNGDLYFAADDGVTGSELWRVATTVAEKVADIAPGAEGSSPQELTVIGDVLTFTAWTPENGRELWKTDGTPDGTTMVKAITPSGADSEIAQLTALGNSLVFVANDTTSGKELWRSDGTADGTHLIAEIQPGPQGCKCTELTAVDGVVYLAAEDAEYGAELWRTDGTEEGTWRVQDIHTGPAASDPKDLHAAGTTLLFSAIDEAHGREPWLSDGTANGTLRFADIAPGTEGSDPTDFVTAEGSVYFAAKLNGVRSLWRVHLSVPPTVTTGGSIAIHTEGEAPTFILSSAAVEDPDSYEFAGGRIVVEIAGDASGDDELSLQPSNKITVVDNQVFYNGALIGIVTASSSANEASLTVEIEPTHLATPAAITEVLRHVVYRTHSDDPPAKRDLSIRVSDGDGSVSDPATHIVSILSVNDIPVLGSIADVTLSEDATANGVDLASIVSDVDSASDLIEFRIANADVIEAAFGLSIGGLGTDFQPRADNTIQVAPAANFFGETTVEVQARDDEGALSAVATFTLTVTPANDSPVVSDAVIALTLNESTLIDLSTLTEDVDGPELVWTFEGSQHGTVTLLEDGKTASFAPNFAGYCAGFSFQFVASDGSDISNVGTVTADITAALSETVCDDGDACTITGCGSDALCATSPLDCDDGSLCTTDSCDSQNGCANTGISCDDGDPCTIDSCDPSGGCVWTDNPECSIALLGVTPNAVEPDSTRTLTLTGTGFTGTLEVSIGGAEILEIDALTDTTLEVIILTPVDGGLVDVSVAKPLLPGVSTTLEDGLEIIGDAYCTGVNCGTCEQDADCMEGDVCTQDACVEGVCAHDPLAQCCPVGGECDVCSAQADMTGDLQTDIFDVQCSVLVTLWSLGGKTKSAPICLERPYALLDLNCDGDISVVDILLTIRAALGLPLDPSVDVDGDGCHDACGNLDEELFSEVDEEENASL